MLKVLQTDRSLLGCTRVYAEPGFFRHIPNVLTRCAALRPQDRGCLSLPSTATKANDLNPKA